MSYGPEFEPEDECPECGAWKPYCADDCPRVAEDGNPEAEELRRNPPRAPQEYYIERD